MKMHANARLSLKGRELLIDRVENAGWSLIAAAEAAGSAIAPRASGWPATGRRDAMVCWIAPQPPRSSLTAPRNTELR